MRAPHAGARAGPMMLVGPAIVRSVRFFRSQRLLGSGYRVVDLRENSIAAKSPVLLNEAVVVAHLEAAGDDAGDRLSFAVRQNRSLSLLSRSAGSKIPREDVVF